MSGESPSLASLKKDLKQVVEWMSLGTLLNVPFEELQKIAVKYGNDVENCKLAMLDFWLKNSDGSYKHIVASLYSIGHSNLAEKLQQDHRISASSFNQFWTASDSREVAEAKYMIQKEDKNIKEKYAQFMMQLQELLKERKVRVEDIKLYVCYLEGTDTILTPGVRQAKDIPSLFMESFSSTKFYWNTEVSYRIAHHFGAEEGKKLVDRYEAKLKRHFSRRTKLKLPIVGRAKKMVLKINRDYNNYSEENIEDFRHTISRLLKIQPWEIMFDKVEQGCVKLTFIISSIHVGCIKDIVGELERFDVISLSIDGVIQWSAAGSDSSQQNMDQRPLKRTKELEEIRPMPIKKTPRKSNSVYRGGNVFGQPRMQYHRCPKRKQCSLTILVILLLVLLYIIYHYFYYLL